MLDLKYYVIGDNNRMKTITERIPGILLCLLIAVPAELLVRFVPALEVVGAPVIAILAGMIITLFYKKKNKTAKGIAFTSKKVLQYAVILLGFGLNLSTIAKVGAQSLPIIISTIATSLITSFLLYKLMKVPPKISTLIGVGSSICGGSAVAATAPVIDADDEEIAQAISVIFLFNVLAALIFPTLGGLLGMSDTGFSLFAGTAVNDTSSVTAAASTWETLHNAEGVLDNAVIVKLTRTLAIIPITLVLAFYRLRRAKKAGGGANVSIKSIFPMFILWFVAASVITTILNVALSGNALETAESVFAFLKSASKFFIVMAMGAIGLNTDIVKLVKTGGRPIFMGFCCWVLIALVSILMQHSMGLL